MKILILFLIIIFASYLAEATSVDFIGNSIYINNNGKIIKVEIDPKDIATNKVDEIVRKVLHEIKDNVQK